MKVLITMNKPYDAIVGICGIVSGGFAYLRANLDFLDTNYFITLDKVFGLLWGILVALLTGMAALVGKSMAQWAIKKYYKNKPHGRN